jgi:hypothetical protein
LAIWSTIEVGLGIIAGSIATFRPLLLITFGKAKSPTGYNVNGTPSGGKLPVLGPSAHSSSQKDLMRDTWTLMTFDDAGLPPSLYCNNESAPLSSNATKANKLPSFITNLV